MITKIFIFKKSKSQFSLQSSVHLFNFNNKNITISKIHTDLIKIKRKIFH